MSEQEQPEGEELAAFAEAVDGNEAELATLVDRLDDVNELLDGLALALSATDDEMVEKLAATGTELGAVADAAAEPETARGVESMLHAVGDATDLEEPPERVGILGLLAAMRDPEVQAGMGFLLAVAGNLGADLTRRAELRQGHDHDDAGAGLEAERERTGVEAEGEAEGQAEGEVEAEAER
jgi:uncharacterized protein YjgD (DUF1641 family)